MNHKRQTTHRIQGGLLLITMVFAAFDLKTIVQNHIESQQWQTLAAQRDTQTIGQVQNTFVEFDQTSGQPKTYTVVYQFLPSSDDWNTISEADLTALDEILGDSWTQTPSGNEANSNVPSSDEPSIPVDIDPFAEENLPDDAPLFHGSQEISAKEHTEMNNQMASEGVIQIAYASNNPDNSVITVADDPPEQTSVRVAWILFLFGLWSAWKCIDKRK